MLNYINNKFFKNTLVSRIRIREKDSFRSILHSNQIATVISQIIGVVTAIILGKLIALYITPEEFGQYNLEFGIVTFALTLFISPVIQFYKIKVPGIDKNNTKYLFVVYAIILALLCSVISILSLLILPNLVKLFFLYKIPKLILLYKFVYFVASASLSKST